MADGTKFRETGITLDSGRIRAQKDISRVEERAKSSTVKLKKINVEKKPNKQNHQMDQLHKLDGEGVRGGKIWVLVQNYDSWPKFSQLPVFVSQVFPLV